MKSVALATYEKLPELSGDDKLVLEPLARLGISARPVRWDDASVDWRAFDAVVLRSTWDYYKRLDEFLAWLTKLEAQGVRVLNSPATVRWNSNKTYLAELEGKGVPVVPTLWLRNAAELVGIEWDEFVLKPSVSAGAFKTFRAKQGDLPKLQGELGPMSDGAPYMAQPFLASIQREGEYSFLFFGGKLSHVVLKKPAHGDFRVQHTHGGTIVPVALDGSAGISNEEIALASRLARELAPNELYARVDMARVDSGKLVLVEIELIEPFLYLAHDAQAPARFAAAIGQQLR